MARAKRMPSGPHAIGLWCADRQGRVATIDAQTIYECLNSGYFL